MQGKSILVGLVVGVLLSSAVVVLAGSLDPPSGPTDAGSQMHTLEQIYDRLATGAAGSKMASFTEPAGGQVDYGDQSQAYYVWPVRGGP